MAYRQTTDHGGGSPGWGLLMVTGAVVGLGSLGYVAWKADQRALALRPRDSAPQRARRIGLAQGEAQSCAVSVAAALPVVLQGIAGNSAPGADPGQPALAQELLGDDTARFRQIEHGQGGNGQGGLGDHAVVSWRTEDGIWLVKLILRPVRNQRMTSITAIVAREDNGVLPLSLFGAAARTRIKQVLTRFRMQMETGEIARAS